MVSVLKGNIKDLDAMLHDLSTSAALNRGLNHDYQSYSDLEDSSCSADVRKTPRRPPPPKDYSPSRSLRSKDYDDMESLGSLATTLPRRPPKPPKLQHVLVNRSHDLAKAGPRDEDIMEVPDVSDYAEDYSSKWEYHEPASNNTTADTDYNTLASTILSDKEGGDLDTGEAPRGDKSMVIKTDYGELKSKYHYLGFGLWENTEPRERAPPPKKPSPPPPPPKAEPIWYNCTVSVETHMTSKELDELLHGLDGYSRMPQQSVELGQAGADVPGHLGDLHEPFVKEDMSEMFRRAFLEQMSMSDECDRKLFKCCVCAEWIKGRIITAMSQKFHPECFVCTYCRKEFKDRTFKTDPQDGKPYCHFCFEKLLGHFGNAH